MLMLHSNSQRNIDRYSVLDISFSSYPTLTYTNYINDRRKVEFTKWMI